MKVDVALLCDAVTVREGLLNILGGGVTQTTHPSYPATFEGGLALRILLHPTEAGMDHQLNLILQSEDGKRLVEVKAGFRSETPPTLVPGQDLSLALAVALSGGIPTPGMYSFEILIDGIHQESLPLLATQG